MRWKSSENSKTFNENRGNQKNFSRIDPKLSLECLALSNRNTTIKRECSTNSRVILFRIGHFAGSDKPMTCSNSCEQERHQEQISVIPKLWSCLIMKIRGRRQWTCEIKIAARAKALRGKWKAKT